MDIINKLTNRIVWIDWAKSICMFLVVLGHCHIRESEYFVTQFIYSFHMMLFFFLSGLLCKRKLNLDSLKKDLQYLLFPYFTYGFILILFNLLRSRTIDLQFFIDQVGSLFLGLDSKVGPIWFLPALFICKQLFLILKKLKMFSKLGYYSFVLLSFIPAFFLSSYHINLLFFSDSALCGLPFFIMGNELYPFFIRNNNTNYIKGKILPIIIAILFVLSVYLSYANGFVSIAECIVGNSIFLYYLNAICGILFVYLICQLINGAKNTFITITSYGSIVTLGLHGILLIVFNYYIPIILGHEPTDYSLLFALFYSIITYYLCYLFIIVIDNSCFSLFGLKGHFKKN